ncbi:MAG: MEDS domain-containing protein [Actinobacteria bacterium]|nr:MEDS domain-containing protein [Actinomycetota bacterium]
MERKDLIPELKDLAPGAHLCHLYGDEEEGREVLRTFLREGLLRGEKVLCVAGEDDRTEAARGLSRMGVNVAEHLTAGSLSFFSPAEAYLPDGYFDPRATLRFLSRQARAAAAGGWPSLRIAGKMSWALDNPHDWKKMVQCEAEINRLPEACRCVIMCQYDATAFDPSFLVDLLHTHPLVVVGGELFDNVYYVPPGEFLGNMVPQSVLRHHLVHLEERKRAVAEIQAAREYAEAIVETIREPLLVLDAGLRVITANRSFYRTFQVNAEETEGRLLYELGDRQWDIPELRMLLEEIVPLNSHFDGYEVEHDFPRIGRRSMLLNARRVYREGNRTDMILLAIEDVTARRSAEERVQKLNRMFLGLGADFLANMETVLYACQDIMECDLAAYARLDKGRLSLLNTTPGEGGFLLCEEPSRFLGWPLLSGDHAGLLETTSSGSGESWRDDPLAERHGFLSFLGYPVLLQDRVIGVLSIYYHKERHRRGEDDHGILAVLARTLSIEEERLAREQGLKDFIDVASHELRHPVTLVKGYALSLRERWEELPEGEAREMLAAVDEGVDRLTRLVEGLLDVSSIERGRFRLELQEAELPSLVRRALDETVKTRGRLKLRLRGKTGTCLLDPTRFLEVMVILLENARKFSTPCSPVEVEVERKEDHYLISVLDRGPGIPEEDRERVFERFHQVEKAPFHSKPGLGMGLYVAREIVERHHGKIWYEPRDGGGSVFRFTIPASPDINVA